MALQQTSLHPRTGEWSGNPAVLDDHALRPVALRPHLSAGLPFSHATEPLSPLCDSTALAGTKPARLQPHKHGCSKPICPLAARVQSVASFLRDSSTNPGSTAAIASIR